MMVGCGWWGVDGGGCEYLISLLEMNAAQSSRGMQERARSSDMAVDEQARSRRDGVLEK
jgi:hypothetical protein